MPIGCKKPDLNIGGNVEAGFETVAEAFRQNFIKGREIGAMFAVYYEGKPVVDLWGGFKDKRHTDSWEQDTICTVMSVTKGVCATCLAVLADRGLLNYDMPVAHYWPEFAQNGKENITVKTLISHQAGVLITDEHPPLTLDVIKDHKAVGELLARQKPAWEPGSGHGYHAIAMGWLMDQLVRRVDTNHRSVGQFFKEEIAEPFDIDFHIGLPPEKEEKVAELVSRSTQGITKLLTNKAMWKMLPALLKSGSIVNKSQRGLEFAAGTEAMNKEDFHQAEVPSMNGIGSARALAKLYSILANGGQDVCTSQRLLSEETCAMLNVPLTKENSKDILYHLDTAFSVGFDVTKLNGRNTFGHPGLGGHMAYADPEKKLSWAYVTNDAAMYGSPEADTRYHSLRTAMYDCVQKI